MNLPFEVSFLLSFGRLWSFIIDLSRIYRRIIRFCLPIYLQYIVMLEELAEYFNRFYNIVFKELLADPVVHSQWVYFTSMFRGPNLEKERLELYLNILTNEKNKKQSQLKFKQSSTKTNPNHNYKLPLDNIRPQSSNSFLTKKSNSQQSSFNDASKLQFNLTLQKRNSDNTKTVDNKQSTQIELNKPQNLHLRRLSSLNDSQNRPRLSANEDSKSKKDQQEAHPRPNPFDFMSHASALNNEKYRKMCDISKRILRVFQEGGKRA